MMQVLLDMNVVLDLFLHRQPWSADAAALWKAQRQRKIDARIAAFSIPTIYYIVSQQNPSQAISVVDDCLATLPAVPVDQRTLRLARSLDLGDFEDSLQAACAAQAGLEFIVTRDLAGFTASPVPVISASELRARLRRQRGRKHEG